MTMQQLTDRSFDLIERWSDCSQTDSGRRCILEAYITKWLESNDSLNLELNGDEVWYNVSSALSEERHLRGRLLVVDFFTYCCVNCLHVLPALHKLQHQHPPSTGLLIVGVHSAKFTNEQSVDSLGTALRRYSVQHPVVNDASLRLWNAFHVSCWPTLVVIGPRGQPLLSLVGESHISLLTAFISTALGILSSSHHWPDVEPEPVPMMVAACSASRQPVRSPLNHHLLFPGNSCVLSVERAAAVGAWSFPVLVLVDTGHHRILVIDTLSQKIVLVIGGGASGFRDGNFSACLFNSPQGVTVASSAIYVADTGNHAIRKIDFQLRQVTTLYGRCDDPGQLRSPWDVCAMLISDTEVLFISAAGNHQIWAYVLCSSSVVHLGQVSLRAGECAAVAGSGEEACRNHQYKPLQAALAQPSGLAVCPASRGGQSSTALVVADSESSSVRELTLNTDCHAGRSRGTLSTLAGGARDPTDLFTFGDVDTPSSSSSMKTPALLQHPLAVACDSQGVIYVADTYNHRVKVVERSARGVSCRSLTGTGARGEAVGSFADSQFDEPSGLSLDERAGIIYVSDTNNHRICRIHLHHSTVDTMELATADALSELPSTDDTTDIGEIRDAGEISAHGAGEVRRMRWDVESIARLNVPLLLDCVKLRVTFTFADMALTEGAPSAWNVSRKPMGCEISPSGGPFAGHIDCSLSFSGGAACLGAGASVLLLLQLYLCSERGVCCQRLVACRLLLETSSHVGDSHVLVHLDQHQLGLRSSSVPSHYSSLR